MPSMARIMMKLLITSLPLSTPMLFHRKSFIDHTTTSSWCVKIMQN
jgi:hypothetical protein